MNSEWCVVSSVAPPPPAASRLTIHHSPAARQSSALAAGRISPAVRMDRHVFRRRGCAGRGASCLVVVWDAPRPALGGPALAFPPWRFGRLSRTSSPRRRQFRPAGVGSGHRNDPRAAKARPPTSTPEGPAVSGPAAPRARPKPHETGDQAPLHASAGEHSKASRKEGDNFPLPREPLAPALP